MSYSSGDSGIGLFFFFLIAGAVLDTFLTGSLLHWAVIPVIICVGLWTLAAIDGH